jgi:hypothetical protein
VSALRRRLRRASMTMRRDEKCVRRAVLDQVTCRGDLRATQARASPYGPLLETLEV